MRLINYKVDGNKHFFDLDNGQTCVFYGHKYNKEQMLNRINRLKL